MVQKTARELAEDERVRIKHWLDRMLDTVKGAMVALDCDGPIGYDAPQSLTTMVQNLSAAMARHDAFLQVAQAERGPRAAMMADDAADSFLPGGAAGGSKRAKT